MLRVSEYVSAKELKSLCQLSDWQGWYRVFYNYALIYLGFLLFLFLPNPFTFLISACLIAGRILGLGILNHDAGHNTLFKSSFLNRLVGRWLLGGLIIVDYDAFKNGHSEHHRLAGSGTDPDLILIQNYPATKASMKRKFFRDMSGINGIKELIYQIKVSTVEKRIPNIVSHAALLSSLVALGAGWTYLTFWFGFIFIYPAFTRLRIMGEHGAVLDNNHPDPRINTRTTYANAIERLFIAPNHVNFHLEHHIHQNIPAHNLKKAHKLFKSRGAYDGYDCVANGYWDVLKRCVSDSKGHSNTGAHAPSSVPQQS
ncbi:MAG: fatty acid desaturase family protein [Aliiglaciecola sp.]